MTATIVSIQVGQPRRVESRPDDGKTWTTGFGKQPIEGPAFLGRLNLEGDGQADLKHHGGPDKAVCVYPAVHYPLWNEELDRDFSHGAFGENLTISDLTECDVCIGDIWQIEAARVQVSQPRQPCWKLSRWWGIDDLAVRVQKTGRTGWYFRVLDEGVVESGNEFSLIERVHPDWTIEAANHLMHDEKENVAGATDLAALPELSASWRETLSRRVQRRTESSPEKRLFGSS